MYVSIYGFPPVVNSPHIFFYSIRPKIVLDIFILVNYNMA